MEIYPCLSVVLVIEEIGNVFLVSFVFLADLNGKFPGAYSSANLVIILISKEFRSGFCFQVHNQDASL